MVSTFFDKAQANNQVQPLGRDEFRGFRLEIDEFLLDNHMTNLYLLALEATQKEDVKVSKSLNKEDWWTFYSIAAIHGVPEERHNGIANLRKEDGNGGYCHHGATTFPTWHRPYTAMFEQAMANKMYEIANQFPAEISPNKTTSEREEYIKAAKTYRQPYWDPYMPRNKIAADRTLNESIFGFPKILAAEKVWVMRPNGKAWEKINNPLFSFKFPHKELASKDRIPIDWDTVKQDPPLVERGNEYTIRAPNINQKTEGLDARVQEQAINGGTKFWHLISHFSTDPNPSNDRRTWESFASHTMFGAESDRFSRGNYTDTRVSLESWHDDIHDLIGTGDQCWGHMAEPSIAGFDPIFMLHHCNVDRILAMFQALYPDKWMSKKDEEADLYPFQKAGTKNGFWTSKAARDYTALGYEGLENKKFTDEDLEDLENMLYENYSWISMGGGARVSESVASKWPIDLSRCAALHGPDRVIADDDLEQRGMNKRKRQRLHAMVRKNPKLTVRDQALREEIFKFPKIPSETLKNWRQLTWDAQLRVKKFAFNGSFNVHLFIGDIDRSHPERFFTEKNEVGFSGIFASTRNAPCANCETQRAAGIIYEDEIPITPSLFSYLTSNNNRSGPLASLRTLESFEAMDVIPFLRQNLKWIITDTASNILDIRAQPEDVNFEIQVVSRWYTLPTSANPLGTYHPWTEYEELKGDEDGGFNLNPMATTVS